jgi:hypothetical protein
MKKTIILLAVFFGSMTTVFAQDIVVKHDGTEIPAVVTEITDTEIKYKMPDRSVVYTVSKSEVFMIKYANGAKDVFTKKENTSENHWEQSSTPPHAASTRTWTFGDQTWSDAIHMPDCNKTSYSDSYGDNSGIPQCRSYTSGGDTFYYYNWMYLNQNEAALCPSPWRAPTSDDFRILARKADAVALSSAWGFGGYAVGVSVRKAGTHAFYWAANERRFDTGAWRFFYNSHRRYVESFRKYYGHQVRCVK